MNHGEERAWTLPAAAGLAALEVTVTISVLLYGSRFEKPLFLAILVLKYPVCWMLLRRQAWAFLALLLWEFSVAFAAVFTALLFMSTHLFPRAQLPRR